MTADKQNRMKVVHALIRASNAFRESLRADGYDVSRNLRDDIENGTGEIIDLSLPEWEFRGVGTLTLKWKLRINDKHKGEDDESIKGN